MFQPLGFLGEVLNFLFGEVGCRKGSNRRPGAEAGGRRVEGGLFLTVATEMDILRGTVEEPAEKEALGVSKIFIRAK